MPVVIGPGQMQFTVMPSRPSSTASERVSPTTPAFAAEYGLCNAVAPSASVEAILTIRGDFDLRKYGSAARTMPLAAPVTRTVNPATERLSCLKSDMRFFSGMSAAKLSAPTKFEGDDE